MTKRANIYILSKPIQTGKTTLLHAWCKQQSSVGGILTPDVEGKRMLFDLAQNRLHTFQLNDEDNGVKIGRFTFSEHGFNLAQELVKSSVKNGLTWTIIDEIGRLELNQQQGLEPTVSETITQFKHQTNEQNLLLVIRDYLLLEAIAHYQLQDAIIIDDRFLQTALPLLNGVVLCGGQSVRMGTDKAFISYHQQPQFAHVFGMMQSFCNQVVISCNAQQKTRIPLSFSIQTDSATFANCGPISGVLTQFEINKNDALLVIGCDYPYFTLADMKALIDARDERYDAVCYYNSDTEFTEPLLAIYEQSCAPLLHQFWQSGQQSLNHFLKTIRTKHINAKHNQNLTSVDTK